MSPSHGAADPRGDRGCACRGTLRGGARDGGCAAACRAGSVPRPRPHPRRCPQPLKADHPPAVGPPGAGQRVGMFWTRLCAEPPPLGPAPPSPHAALCVCSGVSSARRCVHTSGTEPGAHRAVTASGCVCGVTAPVCAALRACTHTHTYTHTRERLCTSAGCGHLRSAVCRFCVQSREQIAAPGVPAPPGPVPPPPLTQPVGLCSPRCRPPKSIPGLLERRVSVWRLIACEP